MSNSHNQEHAGNMATLVTVEMVTSVLLLIPPFNGIPRAILRSLVKATLTRLDALDWSSYVSLVLEKSGLSEDAESVDASNGGNIGATRCPVANAHVIVDRGPGDYTCPHCKEDVTLTKDGEALHAEMLCYTCSETKEDEYVLAEEGVRAKCAGCKQGVLVELDQGYWKVFHQVSVE